MRSRGKPKFGKPEPPPPPPKPEPPPPAASPLLDPKHMRLAQAAIEGYWGRSNGGPKAYREANDALAELGLELKELKVLRANLPASAPGTTTGQKIEMARNLVDTLILAKE